MTSRRKVFVFSDWHLGGDVDERTQGRVGTQICRSSDQIADFIDWVGAEAEAFSGITEIVINGDMVDFLAPDSDEPATEWITDQTAAIRRLDRIIARTRKMNGRGPFDALRDFLSKASTELTISIGNHDVELSLPLVRYHLAELLGYSPRLRMVYDGEAITRGRLLIEHGNRYDSWNALSFNGLREERSHLSRGLKVEDRKTAFFRPPAGSLMVIYAINSVLAQVPFINLLKPETKAALPLLIALEPNLVAVLDNILRLAPIVPRKFGGRLENAAVPANRDNLTGDHGSPTQLDTLAKVLRPMLGADADRFLAPPESPLGVAQAAQDAMSWIRQRSAQISATLKQRLNLVALVKEATHAGRLQLLEIAFQRLRDDDAFVLDREASEYFQAAEVMLKTGKFDLVIFGHTHLQKKVEIQREGLRSGFYMNTGTWADIMRLPDVLLHGGVGARPTMERFFADITDHNIWGYLFTSLGYAEVELESDQVVHAELRSFTRINPRAVPLSTYA
jgi:UDP-2,3-diacylglucosamine pyrophosphatase LpxH